VVKLLADPWLDSDGVWNIPLELISGKTLEKLMFSSQSYMEVKLHFIDLFVLLKIQTFIHFYIFLKVHYVTFGPVAANKKTKSKPKKHAFYRRTLFWLCFRSA